MEERISLELLDKGGIAWAQEQVTRYHYLRRPVDSRTSLEGYAVYLDGIREPVGIFLVGRPEATRCGGWYGSVDDVLDGRCECTRWQILNLSRVWFDPRVQPGGAYFHPRYVPGFEDRKGQFRSTLVSNAIQVLIARVGYDYLIQRPLVFSEEPYEISWLISYCNTSLHKGTIYAASGFDLYRTNDRGIQTWRVPVPALTPDQDRRVRDASMVNPRANKYRAIRAQLKLGF